MSLRQIAWMLEDKVWVRRSYRDLLSLNATQIPSIDAGIVPFGSDAHQVLLWFAPKTAPVQRLPIVFFFHGGGWHSGDPSWHRFVGRHFAQRGYVALVPGYRLAPQSVFPAQLHDVHTAFALGRSLARERGWGGRAVLIGHSAGGHLAALLAYGAQQLGIGTVAETSLAGLILLGAPLSFAACVGSYLRAAIRTLVGPAGNPADADPVRYVSGEEPFPVLCLNGGKDYLIAVENAHAFIDRVNAGVNAIGSARGQLRIVPRAHHADLIDMFARPSAVTEAVHAWIRQRA